MPPGGAAPAGKTEFLSALGRELRGFDISHSKSQGRAVLRRLNRYEFENSLRDLLQAPWLQLRDSLPEDGLVQRLNKSGSALDISHVQIARYMETADSALRQVLASSAQPMAKQRYYARDQKRLQGRMRYSSFNRHPERASIPVIGYTAQPDVLAEKAPFSDPKTRETEAFAIPASTYTGNEYHFDQFSAKVGGRYQIRFSAYSIWIATEWLPSYIPDRSSWWHPVRERTSKGRTTEPVTLYAFSKRGEKRLLGSFDVTPEPSEQVLTVDLLPGESILPDASRLFRSRPGFIGSPDASAEGMPGVAYRWMEVEGPAPNPANQLPMPTRAADVAPLLNRFLDRAYRRPPTAAERERYLQIVQRRLAAQPNDWTEAMIAGYTAILCSPGFLFLEEPPGKLPGTALASRLSYFLWNGPPDAELRTLAANGRLLQPAVLRAQTERLLNDPKAKRSFDAFLDYWLDLRKVGDTTPDVVLYPDYYLLRRVSPEEPARTDYCRLRLHHAERPSGEALWDQWGGGRGHAPGCLADGQRPRRPADARQRFENHGERNHHLARLAGCLDSGAFAGRSASSATARHACRGARHPGRDDHPAATRSAPSDSLLRRLPQQD